VRKPIGEIKTRWRLMRMRKKKIYQFRKPEIRLLNRMRRDRNEVLFSRGLIKEHEVMVNV